MSLYTMIGAMSGTSMDGLDLILCDFKSDEGEEYSFKILNAKTFEYPDSILKDLQISKTLDAASLFELDKRLGFFFASCINSFVHKAQINPNEITAIASHGHTVHHRPEKGFTTQIGCGDTIAKITGIKVINDFRQKDVIYGGQGAPLVPIGDQLLFRDRADGFLNIGGFTNICIPGDPTIAFDISPGNLPLNLIANEFGLDFDDGGKIANKGGINIQVLDQLNALSFYHQNQPKSLGTEWLEREFLPILNSINPLEDRMHTCAVHICQQIVHTCNKFHIKELFITGGGAYNDFLMNALRKEGIRVIIPNDEEINFKEALIFAFLGVRHLEKKFNCLSSVTGASRNVCGGILHTP